MIISIPRRPAVTPIFIADVNLDGMDQPEPMLIEGRNRRAACRIGDITPTFAVYFLRTPSTLEPVRQVATKVATEGYR